jgi:hypothetical protein
MFRTTMMSVPCRVVDLSQRPSQSLKCTSNKPLHTITPDGLFYLPALSRQLVAEEKVPLLTLHNVRF